MDILVVIAFVVGVLVAADQVLLFLERRGQVRWRRTGWERPSTDPGVRLEKLFEDATLFEDAR
ncbi:hypothetical protein [Acrocarpospora catenulata]|uniref:hypothetical protein n=1 Tax=Acrocarpospora catenulata TaxID=2836182 RepID=UPI001BDAB96E|nr:hypothetical protein [Acrocarpospora catenulata]